VSGIDIAEVDSLKALDLKWPIREADIHQGDGSQFHSDRRGPK
jgi:hypothetical protein